MDSDVVVLQGADYFLAAHDDTEFTLPSAMGAGHARVWSDALVEQLAGNPMQARCPLRYPRRAAGGEGGGGVDQTAPVPPRSLPHCNLLYLYLPLTSYHLLCHPILPVYSPPFCHIRPLSDHFAPLPWVSHPVLTLRVLPPQATKFSLSKSCFSWLRHSGKLWGGGTDGPAKSS